MPFPVSHTATAAARAVASFRLAALSPTLSVWPSMRSFHSVLAVYTASTSFNTAPDAGVIAAWPVAKVMP